MISRCATATETKWPAAASGQKTAAATADGDSSKENLDVITAPVQLPCPWPMPFRTPELLT